ncbi:MAG: hypothetical protein AABZ53_07020 [Planctomycetota bacterium]
MVPLEEGDATERADLQGQDATEVGAEVVPDVAGFVAGDDEPLEKAAADIAQWDSAIEVVAGPVAISPGFPGFSLSIWCTIAIGRWFIPRFAMWERERKCSNEASAVVVRVWSVGFLEFKGVVEAVVWTGAAACDVEEEVAVVMGEADVVGRFEGLDIGLAQGRVEDVSVGVCAEDKAGFFRMTELLDRVEDRAMAWRDCGIAMASESASGEGPHGWILSGGMGRLEASSDLESGM